MRYGLLSSLIGLLCSSGGVWMLTSAPAPAVTFVPPVENTAPRGSVGGASRGSFQFIPPPDSPAPQRSSSGASRIGFTPPPDNSAPRQSTSGASRDTSFIPPPDQTTPRRTASGGSRNGSEILPLDEDVLLAPEAASFAGEPTEMRAVTPPEFYGLTISARPTIMAYVPESRAHTAVFSLQDESQVVVYQQRVPLNGDGGILRVTLPNDAPELAVGQYYHWFVTLQAEDYLTPGSPYVDAWVKRVEPTLAISQIMSSADDLAVAEALAKMGIWYDSSARLAELTLGATNSDPISGSWSEFLVSVGLNSLVDHSFL